MERVVEGANKRQLSEQGSSSSDPDDSSPEENPAIKAVIDKVLPDLPCTDAAKLENEVYYKVDASSDTTKDQTPPAAWIEEKESDKGSVKEYFSEFANIHTTLEVPATEVSHCLNNEGDVVRASTLYLLHSVNVAGKSIPVPRPTPPDLDGGCHCCRGKSQILSYRIPAYQLRANSHSIIF